MTAPRDPRLRPGAEDRTRLSSVSLCVWTVPIRADYRYVPSDQSDPASWYGSAYVHFEQWTAPSSAFGVIDAPVGVAWASVETYLFAGVEPGVDFPTIDASSGSWSGSAVADVFYYINPDGSPNAQRPSQFTPESGQTYTAAFVVYPLVPTDPLGTRPLSVSFHEWWTPEEAACFLGIYAWYRADSGTGVAAGQSFTGWAPTISAMMNDTSGARLSTLTSDTRVLTSQVSGHDPVHGHDGAVSADVVTFDGTTVVQAPYAGAAVAIGGVRIFVVGRFTGASGVLFECDQTDSTDPINQFFQLAWSAGTLLWSGRDNGHNPISGVYSAALPTADVTVIEAVCVLDSGQTAPDVFRVGGVPLAGTENQQMSNKPPFTRWVIGPGAMDLYEVVFLLDNGTDQQVAAMRAYFQQRYGVSA